MTRVPLYLKLVLLSAFLLTGISPAATDVQVNQDTDNSVQNEPSIAINKHYSGDLMNIVVAYNDIGKSLGASYSPDSGHFWFDVQLPAKWATTGDPSVAADNLGNVYACFLSYEGTAFYDKSGIYVCKSVDGGRTWTPPTTVDELIYTGVQPVKFSDKCMMTVDTNSGSPYENYIYVGWQRDDTNGHNSDVFFAVSNDAGNNFSAPIQVNDNPPQTAYAEGALPFVGAGGIVYMTWYDCYFRGHHPGSLYVDISTDGGTSFGTDIKAANFDAPPKYTYSNSGFKAKSFPSAAADPSDPMKLYITYCADPDGYFDRRVDQGKDPGVMPGGTPSWNPSVDREGSYVYIAWEDYRNGLQDIYFNRSTDDGRTWNLPDIGRLDQTDVAGADISKRVKLSSTGNHVYAIWEDYRMLPLHTGNIFVATSADNGATWNPDQMISTNTGNAQFPAITSIGNFVYAAWQDSITGTGGKLDIYFSGSLNNGVSWSAPIRVDHGTVGQYNSQYARLACQGAYVYCMWLDMSTGGYQPWYNYSANNGVSWSTPQMLSQGLGTWCQMPLQGGIACVGSNVFACWTDDRNGTSETFFNRSTNNGVLWGTDFRINDGGSASLWPFMDVQGSYVYIGWIDNRLSGPAANDVFFDFSADNGLTWQSPDIGPLDGGGIGPASFGVQISSEGSHVYATWTDARAPVPGAGDAYFSRSFDNGATWGAEVPLNHGTFPAGLSFGDYPHMSAGNGYVNVFWEDPRVWNLHNLYTNYSADNGNTFLSGGMDEADVFCVRSTDGGSSWQTPVKVNDDASNWAQVLPWVLVKANGLVDISYYSFRMSPKNLQFPGAELRLATSTNSGASFLPSNAIQDTIVTPMTSWVGEYNGMASLDTILYTVFTDFEQNNTSDILMDVSINPPASSTCCIPLTVGDIDQSGVIDITDVSVLVDNQFLTLTPLACEEEGNINYPGAGYSSSDLVVDITDLTILIDNQFLTLSPLPPCP
ncbi:MAG: exo-alpha-sialidase [bacterium]|nr:exo-alpha-sialidase [bacterium]